MGQRNDFIKVARAELGVIEGPKDNETKYGAFTKANFLPWCGSFVNWCANEVGLKIPSCVSTVAGAQAFIKKGLESGGLQAGVQSGALQSREESFRGMKLNPFQM